MQEDLWTLLIFEISEKMVRTELTKRLKWPIDHDYWFKGLYINFVWIFLYLSINFCIPTHVYPLKHKQLQFTSTWSIWYLSLDLGYCIEKYNGYMYRNCLQTCVICEEATTIPTTAFTITTTPTTTKYCDKCEYLDPDFDCTTGNFQHLLRNW